MRGSEATKRKSKDPENIEVSSAVSSFLVKEVVFLSFRALLFARGIPTLRIALALLIPDDNRVEQGIQTCALFILSTFVIPSSDEASAPLLRRGSHDLALTYPQVDRELTPDC